MMNKVLIVDDHEIVRQGLSLTIKDAFPDAQVYEAGSVGRALSIAQNTPDIQIALIDIQLPGSDGRTLVPKLNELCP